ncbi:MAG: beta-glucosidase [Opitutaceae bacterium]|nr:beta-glucosidase [Opitutaceae bacterium]
MSRPDCFPRNFVWGVATAAIQIEGSEQADGRGASVWDTFARRPGKIQHGHTPAIACDHYKRFPEDIALMSKLGVKNYRMSVAWPRIYPNGDGSLNQRGLDFYSRLVDRLLDAGIAPWVTLFHWDLPQSLEDRGGWTSRTTADAFSRYADTVVRHLGNRVKRWISLNEIRCFTALGYAAGGDKAPGRNEPESVVNQTYHHALLCHGYAVRAVREHGGRGAQVGLTDNSDLCIPVTETTADIEAARAWFAEKNLHLLDPLYRGSYAPSYLRRCGTSRPKVNRGDFDLIALPTDFLGLNVYSAKFVRSGKPGRPETLAIPDKYPRADSPWLRITPQAIYWGPRFAHELYGPKAIYITENGCGYESEPVVSGEVNDLHRREFLRSYLREVHRAIADGVPIAGYFLWSLLDNFEWQDGYTRRFGIVHVDYRTQRRTPKLSAKWYQKVMAENRIV